MLKNIKKILKIIVAMSVLLLLMTVSANADSTDVQQIEVQRVDIKTDKVIPKIGDKVSDLDYDYEVYANETIKLSTENIGDEESGYVSIKCYKKTDNGWELMEDSEMFEFEGNYKIERWFVLPNEMVLIYTGSQISDTDGRINGIGIYDVSWSGWGDTRGEYCFMSCEFTVKSIEKVNIESDGLLPKVGDSVKNVNKDYEVYADFYGSDTNTIKLSTKVYDDERVVNYYLKEGDNLKLMNEEDVFVQDTTCVIEVGFVVPDGCSLIQEKWPCDWFMGYQLTETEGMLNGEKVGYVTPWHSGDTTGEYCSILFEYTIQEEIIENENPVQDEEKDNTNNNIETPKDEEKDNTNNNIETPKEETKKDDVTKAPGSIPYAGGTTMLVVMIVIAIVGIVAYIKNRDLRGI